MRFAVLSDLHGNQYALSAVLEEVEEDEDIQSNSTAS